MDAAAIDRITDQVLRSTSAGAPDPNAIAFLIRRLETTPRGDVLDRVTDTLDGVLDRADPWPTLGDSAAWLTTFASAARLFDDHRLRLRATELASSLRQLWRRGGVPVSDQMTAVDACLCGCELIEQRDLVVSAIDELERVVGAAYLPGAGVAHIEREPNGVRGLLADQVHTASALLTAFEITGRLPYSMLAEELVQTARRTLWDEAQGGFFDEPRDAAKPFALNCEAARVLCRLASLHAVTEYRGAAVIAQDADYRRDAQRALAAIPAASLADTALASRYGLALVEWFGLQ